MRMHVQKATILYQFTCTHSLLLMIFSRVHYLASHLSLISLYINTISLPPPFFKYYSLIIHICSHSRKCLNNSNRTRVHTLTHFAYSDLYQKCNSICVSVKVCALRKSIFPKHLNEQNSRTFQTVPFYSETDWSHSSRTELRYGWVQSSLTWHRRYFLCVFQIRSWFKIGSGWVSFYVDYNFSLSIFVLLKSVINQNSVFSSLEWKYDLLDVGLHIFTYRRYLLTSMKRIKVNSVRTSAKNGFDSDSPKFCFFFFSKV